MLLLVGWDVLVDRFGLPRSVAGYRSRTLCSVCAFRAVPAKDDMRCVEYKSLRPSVGGQLPGTRNVDVANGTAIDADEVVVIANVRVET